MPYCLSYEATNELFWALIYPLKCWGLFNQIETSVQSEATYNILSEIIFWLL